jgi:ADP-ribosylation factor-like protein 2
VDATDRLRIDDCKAELKGLLVEEVWKCKCYPQMKLLTHVKRLAGASLLVFLNKIDVSGSMDVEEVTRALELDRIQTHHWIVVPCSAITGENLEKGLDWVVQDAKDRLFLY